VTKVKKACLVWAIFLLIFAGLVGIDWLDGRAHAQTISPPIMIQSTIPHTACTVAANVTTYCFASDGLYVSLAGAAFIPMTSGVASITVCTPVGANCGAPQTGVVLLNIPKTATATAPAVTLQ
jgi:hypothetical protein